MSTKVGRTVVVILTAALGMLPATELAGATAEGGEGEADVSSTSGTTGACGWWGGETARQVISVSVCATDGVVVQNGVPVQRMEPLVTVSRYACSKLNDWECSGEQHEGVVGRDEFRLDPLLRWATLTTAFGACAVEVEFAAGSPAQPRGGLWENHSAAGGSVGASQDVTRQAQWWGRVCGQFLVAETGQGEVWRRLEGSLSKAGRWPPAVGAAEGTGGGW